MTDEKINLNKIQKGDETQFAKLYDYLFPILFFQLRNFKLTEIDTNDVIHDVFVRLFSNSTRYDETFGKFADEEGNLELGPLARYVYIIAKNIIYDRLRHKRRKKELAEIYEKDFETFSEQPDLEVELSNPEISELLNDALKSLSEREKRVINMRLSGFSYEAMEAELKVSANTVRVLSHRAMQKLRNYLVHNTNKQ